MSEITTTHRIRLDPRYEAWQAGLCTCAACLDSYAEAYERALERVAEARGLSARLVITHYTRYLERGCDAPGCRGECEPLWQEAHEASDWVSSHRTERDSDEPDAR